MSDNIATDSGAIDAQSAEAAELPIPAEQPIDPMTELRSMITALTEKVNGLTGQKAEQAQAPMQDPDDLTPDELEALKEKDPLVYKATVRAMKLAEDAANNVALAEWNKAYAGFPADREKEVQRKAEILHRGYTASGVTPPPFAKLIEEAAMSIGINKGADTRIARATTSQRNALVPNSGARAQMTLDQRMIAAIEAKTGKKLKD